MHEAEVRVRDRYQFQVKLSYLVDRNNPTLSYDLAAYIFVPPTLGVARENFSKSDFYNDLQTFVRLKTPEFGIDDIPVKPDSPLLRLTAAASELALGADGTTLGRFEHQVKLFGCVLDSSLEDAVDAIEADGVGEDMMQAADKFAAAIRRITTAYRRLYDVFDPPERLAKAREAFVFGDEHMSLVVEDHCYGFLQLLPKRVQTPAHGRLLDVIREELAYRREHGFPSIPEEQVDNERVVYRRSVLKNYMRSVLLLSARTREAGTFMRESLFGFAAGVSMIFATAVLFVSQSFYGPLTLPVFLALVIGYVFKDRIKELLRVYLSRKLAGALFDHKTHIYSTPQHRIGVCKESFDFVDDGKLPPEVALIRNRAHITEIEGRLVGETILRYRKHVSLNVTDIDEMYGRRQFDGFNDVLRFNLHEYVARMGAPRMTLFAPTENGYHKIKTDRVYHLNIILRQRLPQSSIFRRFRVVLNRRGIKRVERVTETTVEDPDAGSTNLDLRNVAGMLTGLMDAAARVGRRVTGRRPPENRDG